MKTYICSTTVEFNHFIGELHAKVQTDGAEAVVGSCWFDSDLNCGEPEVSDLSDASIEELCEQAKEKYREHLDFNIEELQDLIEGMGDEPTHSS